MTKAKDPNKRRPRTMRPLAERFWEKVDKRGSDECWPWRGSRDETERGLFYRDGRLTRAPRVAWFLEHGVDLRADQLACHKCDHPWCVNPAHIFAGTDRDNSHDMVRKGRWRGPKGYRHPASKLDEASVIAARARYARGERLSVLASAYGVNGNTMSKALLGKTWKHVPTQESA